MIRHIKRLYEGFDHNTVRSIAKDAVSQQIERKLNQGIKSDEALLEDFLLTCCEIFWKENLHVKDVTIVPRTNASEIEITIHSETELFARGIVEVQKAIKDYIKKIHRQVSDNNGVLVLSGEFGDIILSKNFFDKVNSHLYCFNCIFM